MKEDEEESSGVGTFCLPTAAALCETFWTLFASALAFT
jgi:hypothetical protein